MPRSIRIALNLIVLIAFVSPTLAKGPRTLEDRWYVVEIQGQHAGWMRERTMQEDGERITETVTQFKIRRGQATIAIDLEGTIREDADGRPLSMYIRNQMGNDPIEKRVTFGEDGREIVTEQGSSRTMTRADPIGEDCLTPSRVAHYVKEQLVANAPTMEFTTIAPASGVDPITITRTLIESEVVLEVDGTSVTTSKWTLIQSDAPGVESTEFLDSQGRTVRTETAFGGFVLTTQLTTRLRATRTGRAPELMVNTFVKPSRKIRRARQTSRAVFDLSVTEGELPEFPSTGGQQAVAGNEPEITRLIIQTDANQPAAEGDDSDARYLAATTYLNHRDPSILDLVKRAVEGGEPSKLARAEAMRRFVSRYVNRKDLSTGFASATEVAKNRSGDCTEHAVLLAAMMRADGIPARVATGLIYVDQFAGERGIFGYHMWAQALIEGRWIDYDATLQNRRFDAAHLTVATSPLEDGSLSSDMAALIPLMGRLRIEVVEVEHGR